MNKTGIEWTDFTWNPVTGCLNDCDYCYAKTIADRFGGASQTDCNETVGVECQWCTEGTGEIHELEEPFYNPDSHRVTPFPYYFDPTFHKYRLSEPQRVKTPSSVFVCSMADLFGNWVPDAWIEQVFEACEKAPQHDYIFLTKNPKRYCDLANAGKLPKVNNFWYGTTVTKQGQSFFQAWGYNTFLSIEPILQYLGAGIGSFGGTQFFIIGAETGNKKSKVIPQKAWVDNICGAASPTGAAVFMKDSLRDIMGADFRRDKTLWRLNKWLR